MTIISLWQLMIFERIAKDLQNLYHYNLVMYVASTKLILYSSITNKTMDLICFACWT